MMWNNSRAGSKSREKPLRMSPSLKWATSLPTEPPATKLVSETGEELVQDDAREEQQSDGKPEQDQRLQESGRAAQRVGRFEARPVGRAGAARRPRPGVVPRHPDSSRTPEGSHFIPQVRSPQPDGNGVK